MSALISISADLISAGVSLSPGVSISSEKLFDASAKKVAPNSVSFSDDFSQYSYVSPSMEMFYNGKLKGKFAQVTPITFDSKGNWAFLGVLPGDKETRLNLNGEFIRTEHPPVQISRAGSRGPLIWFEKGESGVRLVKEGQSTGFYPSIQKIRFSGDGSKFTFVYPKKVKPLTQEEIQQLTDSGNKIPESRESDDYLVDDLGTSVLMGRRLGVWPFEAGKSRLEISLDLDPGTIKIGGQKFFFRATKVESPIFDPTESHFAVRYTYTKPSRDSFVDAYNYLVDGIPQAKPTVQTAFAFSKEGTNWILCGREGTQWYFLESGKQPVPMDRNFDFPGCPNEGFKAAFETADGWGLLFQSRQISPRIAISSSQFIELPVDSVDLNSLSTSPNGKWVALVGTVKGKRTQYVIPVGKKRADVYPLKLEEEAGLSKMEKGYWKDDQTFVFITAKGSMIQRNTAKLN